jgi:hypothetical protein
MSLLSACQQKPSDGSGPYVPISEFEITVDYPSGSILPDSVLKSKVPTMFNVGRLNDSVYGMLLGPAASKGDKLKYIPIGVYTLTQDSTAMSFVLCKPDDENGLIKAANYNEWSIDEIRYKSLIDSWFKTNCELNQCSQFEWANDLKALRILEQVQ